MMMLLNAFLACACFASPTPLPQDPGGVPREEADQVVVEYYKPENTPAGELARAMQQLITSRPTMAVETATGITYVSTPSYVVFGETLLIKELEKEMPRTLATAKRLDQSYVGEPAWEEPKVETFHYQVRHVPLQSVLSGLRGAFQQQAGPSAPSISTIDDRGMVIFRGSPEDVKEVSMLIETLDVPLPRLLITVYIIEGTGKDEADYRVPADLARDLGELVPYEAFNIMSMGILPSDTVSPMEMQAMSSDQLSEFRLQMYPQAYDPQTGALNLAKIEFQGTRHAEGLKRRSEFSTSTSLRRGQYTVLGAVGADPIFVVAEMKTL